MKHLQAIDYDLWLLKKWVTSEKKMWKKEDMHRRDVVAVSDAMFVQILLLAVKSLSLHNLTSFGAWGWTVEA